MDRELLESKLAEVQRKWGYVVVASPVQCVVGFVHMPDMNSVNPENGAAVHLPIRIVSEATAEEFAKQSRFICGACRIDVAGWYFYRVETD